MPFLSQDWRGPGEDWVRGQDGWEIMRRGEARDKVMEEKKEDPNQNLHNLNKCNYQVVYLTMYQNQ